MKADNNPVPGDPGYEEWQVRVKASTEEFHRLRRAKRRADPLVILLRHPVLMEDEFRPELVRWEMLGDGKYYADVMSRSDAEAWIAEQKGEYFRPSDYYFVFADDNHD